MQAFIYFSKLSFRVILTLGLFLFVCDASVTYAVEIFKSPIMNDGLIVISLVLFWIVVFMLFSFPEREDYNSWQTC